MTASRRERRERREGFGAWLLFACLLHVALWGALALRPSQQRASEHERARDALDEIEIAELPPPASAADSLGDAVAPEQKQAALLPTSPSRPSVARPAAAAREGAIDSASNTASPPAGAASGEELANAEDPTAETPLSLDALGIGSKNPFVSAAPGAAAAPAATARESARAVGRSRFQRSLAAEIARANQSHALGPEGPVLTSLESIVRNGDAELNSSARFRFVTDAEGHLVSAELLESSSDPRPWRRHAKAVLDAMRGKKLRVPKTGYGVTFVARVESHVQLPSGADPGAEISVLGIPVQHGEGPRSTRIEILNLTPRLTTQEERLPSGQTVSLPVINSGNILSIMGNLSDIGAKARRMVRAHLEHLSVNEVTK